MRCASQIEPSPTVVVTLRSPEGRSLVSTRRARVVSRRMRMSRAARNRRSPCSVRIRPRAWRWNSGALSSRSSALIWRLTADWLRLEIVAGVGEAAGLRDGVEDPDLVPVHGGPRATPSRCYSAA